MISFFSRLKLFNDDAAIFLRFPIDCTCSFRAFALSMLRVAEHLPVYVYSMFVCVYVCVRVCGMCVCAGGYRIRKTWAKSFVSSQSGVRACVCVLPFPGCQSC